MSKVNSTRREFCQAASLALPLMTSTNFFTTRNHEMLVYIGTYTTAQSASGKSEGIYLYRLNLATGELKLQSVAADKANPSFLTIDPRRRFLYAVNEVGDFNGRPQGALSAFAIDQKTGDLKFLNRQASPGIPCHVVVDRTGRYALAANYGGGNVAVWPIRKDGSLDEYTFKVQHKGAGANPQRQEAPHAHCVMLDAANRFAFVADLGLDKVMIYPFDEKKGRMDISRVASAVTKPGAGPRHFTFHPNGRQAFVINELDSTMTVFAYDKAQGTLTELQTISTLPTDFNGESYCADLHVHPNGRFVYGSNRGHNSIVVFGFDEKAGKLSFIETTSTQGNWPRNFAIDPTGSLLLAANQRSDNIVTFRIDAQTGKLTPTGQVVNVPAPVCLKLIPSFR